MASSTSLAIITMAMAIVFFGIQARSLPVSPDPNLCVERDPNLKCCPSWMGKKIVDFTPPQQPSPLRVRRPAHALDPEAAQKYAAAVASMRALPSDHPWSFIQQSNVHCAYCNDGLLQNGLNISLEIHGSWLFFPWHRAYLYFYERILGKLAGDPSFALPFWNWDHPAGMSIPEIYRDNSSSLYNPTRYPKALNFTDIGGCPNDGNTTTLDALKQCNLRVMHRQFAAAFNSSDLFLGHPYRAGGKPNPGGGVLEWLPHGPVHVNTGGDISQIPTSGLDPLFYNHHANVDRLWAIWAAIPGNGSKTFGDPDFNDASFLFVDENLQLVRIRVSDCASTRNLGYIYEDVPLPWLNVTTEVQMVERSVAQTMAAPDGYDNSSVVFPLVLHSTITVEVERKGDQILISDVQLNKSERIWFDVYVQRVGDGSSLKTTRTAAGSFVNMGSNGTHEGSTLTTELRLGISEFVNAIGATDDATIVVILVPKIGGDKVKIGKILIT
ncbi:Polyphenol oxidase, chloroplastic [Apostasia shenzhenica]|uniref:Polyphenol oxidase, chloroplastic n=1 Tax=Apostasia shenzhenica TaxID=1088818 RepID=A0A2I0A3T7_9ASPA|nr:Polyphenol oxidase, chloroplastic [Apostasia shenzhenica]